MDMRRWGWCAVVFFIAQGCAGPEDAVGLDAGLAPPIEVDAGAPPIVVPARCEGRTGVSGSPAITLMHDGILRTVLLHVPETYEATRPSMLVLNFHGFTSADWQQSLLTHMSAAADERRFIVAYPQGVGTSWNAGDCCGTAASSELDDVGFVRALIERLETDYCIDAHRIYATGMSNGGFLSHRLACELSDRIAAIAPVAGVLGIDPSSCTPPRAVPILHFHGTEDALVPYEGGSPIASDLGIGLAFRSVAASMSHWRTHNGCTNETTVTRQNGDVRCTAFTACSADTELCTVEGGGHTWPGGLAVPFLGYTTTYIDATDAMLDFFEAHPLP